MDNTADLWVPFEGAIEAFPDPPAVTRAQLLPFTDLIWENFERLCWRLAWQLGDVIDCRRYGVQGQKQQGIDIYVRYRSDDRYTTWQCKRYESLTASELLGAVDEFLKGEWAGKTSVFHLATTVSLSPTSLVSAVEEARSKCTAKRIEFVPLDEDRLSGMLKDHPRLVDDFFGRAWVKALCGQEAADSLSRRRLTRAQQIEARRRLRTLYETHFSSVDIGLPSTAGGIRHAAPPLPLSARYVVPMVEAVTSVLEAPKREPSPQLENEMGSEVSQGTERRDRPRVESGFKVREHRISLGLLDWLVSSDTSVLLGGPGLGKSAALRFVALDLLSAQPRNEALAKKWSGYLPLFLPFAMLTRLVREREITSMQDFLHGWLSKLSAPVPTFALMDEALEDERLLLVLDGLDEWTDATAASSALTKVLDFVAPRKLPVVASARRLGFERLGSLGPEWKLADLQPFGEKEQREFTRIWFQHFYSATATNGDTEELTAAVKRYEDTFMAELEQDTALANLAGVPLLLSTLIYLRLQGRVLPRNHFDALEEFTKSLVTEQPHRRAQASLQGTGLPSQNTRLAERGIEFLALLIHETSDSDAITVDSARAALSGLYQGDEFRKKPDEAIELADGQIERATHEIGILV